MKWIDVGLIDEIPKLGARIVRTGRGDIAVFRTAGDEVFALDDRCPHRGGPLSQGIVYDRRVACPLHNWVISLDSGEATGPDSGCTRRHEVRVEAGRVLLQIAAVECRGEPARAQSAAAGPVPGAAAGAASAKA